jgi:hypothetical protein
MFHLGKEKILLYVMKQIYEMQINLFKMQSLFMVITNLFLSNMHNQEI